MKQVIIIVTHESTQAFYKDLIHSIAGENKYPVVTVRNTKESNKYEVAALEYAVAHNIDEFILLPDTCYIKDPAIFDILFETYKGFSISLGLNYLSFVGKYRTEIIKQIGIPEVNNKLDAVIAESDWHKEYTKAEGGRYNCLDGLSFQDGNKFVYRHGRENMVLETKHLIKFKGTWNLEMIR